MCVPLLGCARVCQPPTVGICYLKKLPKYILTVVVQFAAPSVHQSTKQKCLSSFFFLSLLLRCVFDAPVQPCVVLCVFFFPSVPVLPSLCYLLELTEKDNYKIFFQNPNHPLVCGTYHQEMAVFGNKHRKIIVSFQKECRPLNENFNLSKQHKGLQLNPASLLVETPYKFTRRIHARRFVFLWCLG